MTLMGKLFLIPIRMGFMMTTGVLMVWMMIMIGDYIKIIMVMPTISLTSHL